jgi:hypothetical protein
MSKELAAFWKRARAYYDQHYGLPLLKKVAALKARAHKEEAS